MRPFLIVLVLAGLASAQTPREEGEKLRESLGKAAPSADLEGRVSLAAHAGLSRIGELRLITSIVEKGGEKLYHLEDRLAIDAEGLGSVRLTLEGDLGADFSVRELKVNMTVPEPSGAIERRLLRVFPEGDGLSVTEARNEEKPVTRKLEGLSKRALVLVPPLGAGERLLRLAKGDVGARLSLEAWDLVRGEKASLAISFDEDAKIDIRGKTVEARKTTRSEGKTSLEEWLVPATREPLKLLSGEGERRLAFVGRESTEDKEDLPAPPPAARKDEGPAATVLRFLRATGRGDAAETESLLDVDAIFEALGSKDRSDAFKATFKKTLLAMLTGPEWRRADSVKLIAGAARAEDLEEQLQDGRATVRPKDSKEAPAFELRKTAEGWKIVSLPRK